MGRVAELGSLGRSTRTVKTTLTISAIAVAAALVVFGQWFAVNAGDDFTLVGPQNYKVFRYGFPFQITECSPELPIRTPDGQIPLRFVANFGVFFVSGLVIVGVVHRWRVRGTRAQSL